MRQNFKTVLIGIIFLVGGLGSGMFLGILATRPDFDALWQENQELYQDIDNLQNEYDNLLGNYTDLQSNYSNLLSDYNGLFSDYKALQEAFEEPLTNPVLPNYTELYSWLIEDNTDIFEYNIENWMCGDFAAMLMTRAKTMNWRMRISCMFWSYSGEVGWQDPADPYGSYGHAFNVILCQDYDGDGNNDWFYIEPQTDKIWYVCIGAEIFVHYDIWLTFTGGITGTVWKEPYFINHYSWFG